MAATTSAKPWAWGRFAVSSLRRTLRPKLTLSSSTKVRSW
jgi:hypothetical protein